MNLNPFPKQNNKENPPVDGLVFEVPHHCRNNYNEKCKKHYEDIAGIDGFHICPYGFTTHVLNIDGRSQINTSILVKGESKRKVARKNLIGKDQKIEISKSEYDRILERYKAEINKKNELQNIANDVDRVNRINDQFEDLITNTIHEVRKLNAQIKRQSEILKDRGKKDDIFWLEDLAYNIFSTSQLISTRLDAYDFTINPNLIDMYKKRPIAVFKKFEKAFHCLKRTAREKNITINLKGKSDSQIDGYRIFELLPFMLLENAIKYSPSNREINCNFSEENFQLKVISIENYGPNLHEDELENLTERGFRGEGAQDIEGSGIGLYLAKLICDFHNIDFKIFLFGEPMLINEKEYIGFKIKLKL